MVTDQEIDDICAGYHERPSAEFRDYFRTQDAFPSVGEWPMYYVSLLTQQYMSVVRVEELAYFFWANGLRPGLARLWIKATGVQRVEGGFALRAFCKKDWYHAIDHTVRAIFARKHTCDPNHPQVYDIYLQTWVPKNTHSNVYDL